MMLEEENRKYLDMLIRYGKGDKKAIKNTDSVDNTEEIIDIRKY